MTKAEVAEEIAKRTGLDRATAVDFIEEFMNVVKESIGRGENVHMRGFGSFKVARREVTAFGLRKPGVEVIPSFHPSKDFYNKLSGN